MLSHLERAIEAAAKALAGKDLTGSQVSLAEGVFCFNGERIDASTKPEALLHLVKVLNPDHDIERLLASEIEVALVLYANKQAELKRQEARKLLNKKGDEATVVAS